MTRLILYLAFLLAVFTVKGQNKEVHNCGTDALHFMQIKEVQNYNQTFEKQAIDWQGFVSKREAIETAGRSVPLDAPVVLPIVFHNMTTSNSGATVVDYDAVVTSLNTFYEGTEISFCLTRKRKNGDSYSGDATEHSTTISLLESSNQSMIGTLITASDSQLATNFPVREYINVYIVDNINDTDPLSGVSGFATLPSAAGLRTDGIFIERRWLQTINHDNMTVLVHEMGHYLGLLHVFGICDPMTIHNLDVPDLSVPILGHTNACSCDNGNCLFNGDMVCDTPPSQLFESSCGPIDTCPLSPGNDDKSNYMDYSPASCKNHFTAGQILKMHFTVDPDFGPRKQLHLTQSCSDCSTVIPNGCTLVITPFTNQNIVPSSQITDDTVEVGTTVQFSTNANLTCFDPSLFTFNWSISEVNSANPAIQGTGVIFETVFSATGNYVVTVTGTNISNPNCFETATYNFQVIASATVGNCNLSLPNSSWTGWNRVNYVNGWNRSTIAPYNLASPASQRLLPLDIGFDAQGFEIITTPTISDANYINIPVPTAVGGGTLPVMRVGRIVVPNEANTHLNGDAYYSSVTFTPTAANCKFRIYYLGVAEFTTTSGISFNPLVTQNSNDTSFGFHCQYNFHNPLTTSPDNTILGVSETGSLVSTTFDPLNFATVNSTLFDNNDFIFGRYTNSNTTPINGQFSRLDLVGGNWQFKDLDFSSFVGVATNITITFFSRSNSGVSANKHSYGYFAIDCLSGGVPKPITLNLQDVQLPCTPPNSENSCYTYDISLESLGLPYTSGFININNPSNTNNFINFTVTPVEPTNTTVIINPNLTTFRLCLTHSDVPFEDFDVQVTTMDGQVVTDRIRVFYGFYYQFNPCPGFTGGYMGGEYTSTTSRDVLFCPGEAINQTFSLENPCMISNVNPNDVPSTDYEWITVYVDFNGNVFANTGITFTATFNTITITNIPNNACSIEVYRRYTYRDPYCGTPNTLSSVKFNLYSTLKTPVFSGPSINACVTDTINVQLYGFGIANCIPPAILSTLNGNGTFEMQVLNPAGDPISTLYTQTITSTSFNITPPVFTFNNIGPGGIPIYSGNNVPILIRWSLTRYGCTMEGVSTTAVSANFEGFASGGSIAINANSGCPTYNFVSIDDGEAGSYTWQFSTDGTNYTDIPGSNNAFLNGFTITNNPTFIRRVAHSDAQTAGCAFDAFSNVIQFPLVPQFSFDQVYCHNEIIIGNPLPNSFMGINGTWSPSTISTATVGVFPYQFIPVNSLCLAPTVVDILILPDNAPTCSCEPFLITSTPIATVVEESRQVWIRATNSIAPSVSNRTVYHAGNFIELLPENVISTHGFNAQFGSRFAAYIDVCSNGFIYKADELPAKQLVLYPNPANEFVIIAMKEAKFSKVLVSSIDGKSIYQKQLDSTNVYQIDLSRYPQGIYLITVIADDGEQFNEKIIKN